MRREIKIRTYSEKLGKYIGEWGVFKNPIDESFQAGPPSGIQGEIYHEQFTGLRDSKGLTDVYEGDIIAPNGEVYANIHEGHYERGSDLLIEGLGTSSWRNTEQEAIKRGCIYAE